MKKLICALLAVLIFPAAANAVDSIDVRGEVAGETVALQVFFNDYHLRVGAKDPQWSGYVRDLSIYHSGRELNAAYKGRWLAPDGADRREYLTSFAKGRIVLTIDGEEFVLPNAGPYKYLSDNTAAAEAFHEALTNGDTIRLALQNIETSEIGVSVAIPLSAMQAAAAGTQAPPAQPAPASQSQLAKQRPYPVSDLPSELTSVALIPFEDGKEEEWREDYLRDEAHKYMDASCLAAAFPYVRTGKYWQDVDSRLDQVNNFAKVNDIENLSRTSAADTCADPNAAAKYRDRFEGLPKGHIPREAFDYLCQYLNDPGAYHRDRDLGTVPACIDLAAVRAAEYDSCMRTRNRGSLKNKSDAEVDAYCGCSGDRIAAYYADGNEELGSGIPPNVAANARGACRDVAQAQPASTGAPGGGGAASSQSATPKPAPAAKPSSDGNSLKKEAEEVFDDAAEKVKKGIGGFFD